MNGETNRTTYRTFLSVFSASPGLRVSQSAPSRRSFRTKEDHHSKARRAFTLIELLVVIAIIGILSGLLYPAIGAAIEQAKKTRAKAEVKAIELAFQAYYKEYQQWPQIPFGTPAKETAKGIKLTGDWADLLLDPTADQNNNPRRVTFLTVNKVNGDGDPVNPWGDDTGSGADDEVYWVKFDANFDGTILKGSDGPPDKDVKRDVIVWTYNSNKDPDHDTYVIGSWK